jgi:serine/threonine-protein kinase
MGVADEVRRFSIERCLGSGGFGEVYLARMVSPGGVETEVAVKVLHEGLDPRSQAVQRLRDEARLLGRLNHPAVLKVRDLVLLEDRVALVMEYVPGADLDALLHTPPTIPLRAGVEVCARVADALAAAHSATSPDGAPLELVHRDIKPSNIRIGRHGDVKLLDFGIARAADGKREAKTQTRVTVGSPWYMAPERFDGISDNPASDVYALGCTLFEVCAEGSRLFEALSGREHFMLSVDPKKHDAHLHAHIEPLALSGPVRSVLEAMLAYEPATRPSASELAHALDDLAEELGSETGPGLRRWVRSTALPDAAEASGALVGRMLTEKRLSGMISGSQVQAPRSKPHLDAMLPKTAQSKPSADAASLTMDDSLFGPVEPRDAPGVAPETLPQDEITVDDVGPIEPPLEPPVDKPRKRAGGGLFALGAGAVILAVIGVFLAVILLYFVAILLTV